MSSLRSRLILWQIIGITLFLATSGFAIHAIAAAHLEREVDMGLLRATRTLVPALRREVLDARGERKRLSIVAGALASDLALLFEVRTVDGLSLLRSEQLGEQSLPHLEVQLPVGELLTVTQNLTPEDIVLPTDGHSARAVSLMLTQPRRGRVDEDFGGSRPFDRPGGARRRGRGPGGPGGLGGPGSPGGRRRALDSEPPDSSPASEEP